ncbi:MAG: RloB domain-containing protein [Bacteroidetes bacterium]|nr:MAG: RloB domain-containing protein [Bacteroidota bacterium]
MGKPKNRKLSPLSQSRRFAVLAERSVVLVACDGEKTEVDYFNSLRKEARGRLTLKIKPFKGGAPKLFQEAIKWSDREHEWDEMWLVFDKDQVSDDEFDNTIQSIQSQAKCRVGWSNPCFELWLCLHFQDHKAFLKTTEAVRLWRDICEKRSWNAGKSLDSQALDALAQARRDALERARNLWLLRYGTVGENPPPSQANPATSVHQLVERFEELKTQNEMQ